MARTTSLPPNLSPRGLSREDAAAYIGVGTTLFDRLVSEGVMPPAKRMAGRKAWDVRALDRAFDALPDHPSDMQCEAASWIDAP